MWWILAVGAVALLIVFYAVGKREIARDESPESDSQKARRDKVLAVKRSTTPLADQRRDGGITAQEVVFHARTFHGFFTNDGLDGLLSNMGAKDLSLNTMGEALTAIGAQPVVPLLKQASLENQRYLRESDASTAPLGSPEQQAHVRAYLDRMRELEAEIDRLGLNVHQLAEAYAGAHDSGERGSGKV